MDLKFERHKDPKEAMGVGLKANSLKILAVMTGPLGNSAQDESVVYLLEKLETNNLDKFDHVLLKSFRVAIEIPDIPDHHDTGFRWIGDLQGETLEFQGKYYQIPEFIDEI